MRLCRTVAIVGLMAALSLPAAASAESGHHVGLHDMTCTSITAMGKGMPRQAALQLNLTNRDTGGTLAGQTVRTSAKGEFMVELPARLNEVLSLRLTVSRPDGSTVAFAASISTTSLVSVRFAYTLPSPADAPYSGFAPSSMFVIALPARGSITVDECASPLNVNTRSDARS